MSINPPPRLLMGPGPINADPRVLRAMSAQLVGQYDPWMTATMNETMALYRDVFRTTNEQTFLVDGTSRAGIEAALVSLLEPGDRVLVPVFGRFGHLLTEIAERCQADVHTIEVPWGEVFEPEAIEAAVLAVRPKVLAIVQGDTSTTMCQPLAEIGEICRRHDVLLYCDATASLGGNAFEADLWRIDIATAGLQKCLGGPSGSAPISISDRAAAVINARKHVEAGIRESGDAERGRRIASNYLDLAMVMDYWGPRRLNHHTEATTMLYGARECALLLVEEGLDAAVDRHELHGRAMLAGVRGLGPRCLRRRRPQDAQRRGGRDPRGPRRGRRARRAARRLRHRDRHLLRSPARQGLADRDDGLQRPQGRRPGHPRGPRAGAPRRRCRRHLRRRRRRRDGGVRLVTTAREVLDRCAELDRFTATPPKLERVYLSREHASANAVAGRWLEQAGLRSWQDAAGNVCGRREGREPGLPALLIGSHLDTVPDAGSYDGMLGVVMAIAVAERLGDRIGELPFALEVIGFSDEEGTRFGTALLGSCAVAGTWQEDWWDLRDRDGQTLHQAFLKFGLDPRRVGDAARRSGGPGRLPGGAHRAGPAPRGSGPCAGLRHDDRRRAPLPAQRDRRGAARRRHAVPPAQGRAGRRQRGDHHDRADGPRVRSASPPSAGSRCSRARST